MKPVPFAALLVQGVLLAGCGHVGRVGTPDPGSFPGKANLFLCTAADCDIIPITMRSRDGACTASFVYRRVTVEPGVTGLFALAILTPEFQYRFTDPANDAKTDDPARNLPGIDIDYGGDPPAFTVRYPDSGDKRRYEVVALPKAYEKPAGYPFKIHTEWSSDNGATWKVCTEVDPVIANN